MKFSFFLVLKKTGKEDLMAFSRGTLKAGGVRAVQGRAGEIGRTECFLGGEAKFMPLKASVPA